MSFNHKFSEKAGSFPEEYADALARDQAAAARAQQAPQAALPVPPTARPGRGRPTWCPGTRGENGGKIRYLDGP